MSASAGTARSGRKWVGERLCVHFGEDLSPLWGCVTLFDAATCRFTAEFADGRCVSLTADQVDDLRPLKPQVEAELAKCRKQKQKQKQKQKKQTETEKSWLRAHPASSALQTSNRLALRLLRGLLYALLSNCRATTDGTTDGATDGASCRTMRHMLGDSRVRTNEALARFVKADGLSMVRQPLLEWVVGQGCEASTGLDVLLHVTASAPFWRSKPGSRDKITKLLRRLQRRKHDPDAHCSREALTQTAEWVVKVWSGAFGSRRVGGRRRTRVHGRTRGNSTSSSPNSQPRQCVDEPRSKRATAQRVSFGSVQTLVFNELDTVQSLRSKPVALGSTADM